MLFGVEIAAPVIKMDELKAHIKREGLDFISVPILSSQRDFLEKSLEERRGGQSLLPLELYIDSSEFNAYEMSNSLAI